MVVRKAHFLASVMYIWKDCSTGDCQDPDLLMINIKITFLQHVVHVATVTVWAAIVYSIYPAKIFWLAKK